MKNSPRFVLLGLLALTFAGCAGGRPVEGLSGRYGRTFSVHENEYQAQVSETWQFNGATSASSRAVWTGSAHGAPYRTVVDQGWSMRYRGRGLFELEEKGRRVDGPPLLDLEDSYEMEIDGNQVQVDGGPSDVPLQRSSESAAPSRAAAPQERAPVKYRVIKKKKR